MKQTVSSLATGGRGEIRLACPKRPQAMKLFGPVTRSRSLHGWISGICLSSG